jgi:hypothetical protein
MACRTQLSGVAIGTLLGGGLLAYSGIKGKGFSQGLQALIAGKNPNTATQTNPIQTATSSLSPAGQVIANSQGGANTYQDFWQAVFSTLGKPATLGNLEAMAGISNFEGLNNYFNPMNIEYHPGDNPVLKGADNWNSVGVQEYVSFDEGVKATAYFLTEPHWAGVNTTLTTGSYDLVNAAIKQAYTWAAYQAPSKATADQILAQRMGQ